VDRGEGQAWRTASPTASAPPNREFVRYDQVDKRQTYHLAEAADGAEAFDEDYVIRTCDLGRFLRGAEADRRAFARELGEALEAIGFAVLEGHGVEPELYDRAHDAVLELFTRTPLEEKLRFRANRHGSVNQGYFPIKETSGIHPDLVEGWVFCRRAFDLGDDPSAPPRLEEFWPRPEAERVFREMCLAHERLILPVMQSLLGYLAAIRISTTRGSPGRTSASGSTTTRRSAPRRRPAAPGGCSGTRTWTCSPSSPLRGSKGSRS